MEELDTHIDACPCGHVYHHKCILTWVNQKRLCPQCKGDALPLIPLTFNLFQLSKEEKALSYAERIGALKSELSTISMNIENEVAEINVLEPQLAEYQAECLVYSQGIGPREQRKSSLEEELVLMRSNVTEIQARNKLLNDESVKMRENLCRYDTAANSVVSRRTIQKAEIPKIVSFGVADARRLVEITAERESLQVQMAQHKERLGQLHQSSLVRSTTKNVDLSIEGFVPIDSKRRRNENISPTQNTIQPTNNDDPLSKLTFLVSLLSDDDDEPIDIDP